MLNLTQEKIYLKIAMLYIHDTTKTNCNCNRSQFTTRNWSGYVVIMLISNIICVSCQETKPENYVIETTVSDQNGRPLREAVVAGGSEKIMKSSPIFQVENANTEITTDDNGKALLSLNRYSGYPSGILVSKSGYYTTRQFVTWPKTKDGAEQSKTNALVTLREIRNPIPMHVRSNIGRWGSIARIPEIGTKYGYDLQVGEACPPLGKGQNTDFHFKITGSYKSIHEYDLNVEIEFPENEGVVMFLTPQRKEWGGPHVEGSRLLSDYMAPKLGYQRSIKRFVVRKSQGDNIDTNVDDQRNYYFKIRKNKLDSITITDDESNYGKIYGDFHFSASDIKNGYYANFGIRVSYFNPNINDRNVEFGKQVNPTSDSSQVEP